MTERIEEISTALQISRVEVEHWVAAGWAQADGSDLDRARLRLLADLRGDLGIDRDTVPVILSLIDQVHTLRGQLRDVGQAIARQPETVRNKIIDELRQD